MCPIFQNGGGRSNSTLSPVLGWRGGQEGRHRAGNTGQVRNTWERILIITRLSDDGFCNNAVDYFGIIPNTSWKAIELYRALTNRTKGYRRLNGTSRAEMMSLYSSYFSEALRQYIGDAVFLLFTHLLFNSHAPEAGIMTRVRLSSKL